MASSPLEIRHASQRSQDSGAYLDWSSDSGSPTRKHSGELGFPATTALQAEQEFITVVSVEGAGNNTQPQVLAGEMETTDEAAAFVTVLAIGDGSAERTSELGSDEGSSSGTLSTTDELHSCQLSSTGSDEVRSCRDDDGNPGEEVLVYRLPGERLGFGLKFEGGTKTQERVRRLFIQSCAADSPASRARCSWGALGEGDELIEIDGVAVNEMTRLDCVRCLKESQVVIRLRVVHVERFTEIPLDEPLEDEASRPLVVSELKKSPPSPPPIPPRKSPRKCPAVPPRESAPLGPPSGFGDPTPPVPRQRQQPPQPEVYLDLVAQEELAARSNCESESDDTGSSISTVVDRGLSSACSFSSERATTPIDLAKVLGPFEQLERELSNLQTSNTDGDSFSLSDDEDEDSSALQPPENFQDTTEEAPPKPAPRNTSPSKFRSGKKRPPPPPPPRQTAPSAPPQPAPRPPERLVTVKPDLVTPPSSPEVTSPPETPTRTEPQALDADDQETAELALWVCTGLSTIGEEEEAATLGELIPIVVPEEVLVLDATRPTETASVPEPAEAPSSEATPEALVLDDAVEVISIAVPSRADHTAAAAETHTRLVPIPEEAPVDMTEEGEHASSVPTSTTSTPSASNASLVPEMPAQAEAAETVTTEGATEMAEEEEVQQPPSAATIKGEPEEIAPPLPPPLLHLHQDKEEESCSHLDVQQRLLSASVPDLLQVTPTEGELPSEDACLTSPEDEMNGLLSLQSQHHVSLPFSKANGHISNGDMHLLNGHAKHNGYCNGGELLSSDDVTPPPSFSRLPPDGHEFPPSYMEPAVAPAQVSKWRQDEKSQRSVKDKIALFSCSEEAAAAAAAESPATLGRFRSTEDIRLSSSGPVSAHVILERAVSTADLQCPPPTVPRFSTLPRKPAPHSMNINTTNVPLTSGPMSPAGLGRALSFSHTRSQSLVDVTGTQKPLSALLEQRRRGISKLRGLVIPERPELNAAAPTVVDLPEIRSRELVQSKTRPLSYEPARVSSMPVSAPPPPPPQQLLPALPSMPKYSPAFKRKSFSLMEIKQQPLAEPVRVQQTYDKSFSNYFIKPDTLTLQCSDPPKSLESLQSSPRSESSSLGGEDEMDSDSAVSSGRSSPPSHENNQHSSLRRTLSSESSGSCTLTGSSSSCNSERRVLKAQSVEATNRKNVLASARSSSGRGGVGSPLIQRRFSDDEAEDVKHHVITPLATTCSSNKPPLVVHTLVQNAGEFEMAAHQQPIKVAYVDEICEMELVPEAPVDTPPPTPESPPPTEAPPVSPPPPAPVSAPPVREPRSPPAVAPRTPPRSLLPQPLRVTEMRAKMSGPAPPVTAPPLPPAEEVCVITTRTVQVSAAPTVMPRAAAPVKDVVDAPIVAPTVRDRSSWQRETKQTTNNVTVSPRNSRQEQVQTFRDIADRWQSMAETTPPPAPVQPPPQPQTAPRTAPAKPGRRSASVNDIRRAFERSPTTSVPATTVPTSHARVSSLDSSASGSCGEDQPNGPGPMTLSSANSLEQLGSISSLASTTSLISQQELQGLLDEAAAEEGAPTGEFLVVVLHRDSAASSVGITLAGGADYEARDITVHKVLGGSPAERDGRVQKGDRILSINGRSMKGLTHREALLILKAPRPEVVLVVSRGRSEVSEDSSASASSTPRVSLVSPAAALPEDAPVPSVVAPTGAPVLVSLSKDGAGLGFSLEGGKDSPLGDRPLTVKKVFTGGAAEKSGQLHAGDHLLAVNGTDVSCMSRIEAWGLMKRLPAGPVTLLVRPQ